jgi:hypothetical protein
MRVAQYVITIFERPIDSARPNARRRLMIERVRPTLEPDAPSLRSVQMCSTDVLAKLIERRGSEYETGFRSAVEIPARWDFGDFPLRRTHLDLVGRPDQQACCGALAAMAAVEAGPSGPDPGRSDLGTLPSGPRALGGRRGDLERICTSAWRACPDPAACLVGRHHRAWRRVGRQSPRQFVGDTNADLAPGQPTEQPAGKKQLITGAKQRTGESPRQPGFGPAKRLASKFASGASCPIGLKPAAKLLSAGFRHENADPCASPCPRNRLRDGWLP